MPPPLGEKTLFNTPLFLFKRRAIFSPKRGVLPSPKILGGTPFINFPPLNFSTYCETPCPKPPKTSPLKAVLPKFPNPNIVAQKKLLLPLNPSIWKRKKLGSFSPLKTPFKGKI